MTTIAQHYIDIVKTGEWQTSKTRKVCNNRPLHFINENEQYLNTDGKNPNKSIATIKICRQCAEKEIE